MAVIDADGLVLGRLCTHVAKRLLNGEEIAIVNAENAIVSGNRVQLLAFYKQRRSRGQGTHGPYYPRNADTILKRSVRGMLEYKKPSGRAAYKRLRVYVGVPESLKDQKPETLESAKKPHLVKYVHLKDITLELGSSRELNK
ncbi:MAG: 50S ribosomal protein L13 [Candidatus Thermoplasmatota archaeon]|nr:50S ribosomal protein L13 [Candidatus Thermoplasmatota archaeon]